jgi:serine/threonine protein kinase
MSGTDVAGGAPLAPGDRVLDRYVVVEHVDTGGTSVVYRGEDERLSRPVCIKVFNTLRDKEWLYRTSYEHFVQEAFALSRLSHPNTLRIYDFGHLPDPHGTTEGLPFQVSEFMNGGTLSHLIRGEGPMPLDEAQQVVAAICAALDEAHHADIIHRDIKPKNILFGTTGQTRQPKLADFGIAKSLAIDAAALRNTAGDTHVVAGRRLLMYSGLWAAPEQLAAHPVGPATDVYSWALVTLYMITGRSVFTTSDPGEAFRQRQEVDAMIDRVSENANLPPAVVALFKRACDFQPERRPASAGDFARELASAFDQRRARRMPLQSPDAHLDLGSDFEVVNESVAGQPGPRSRRRSTSPPALAAPPPAGRREPARTPPGLVPRQVEIAPRQETSIRVMASPEPQPVGDRQGYFVPLEEGVADLVCAKGVAKIRISMVPSASSELAVHVRGLNCFVRKNGGRPSGATQLEQSGAIDLIAVNQQPLGTAIVHFSRAGAGHHLFPIGDELVAIASSEATTAIAIDFGPGAECMFVCDLPPSAAHRSSRWKRR